MKKTTVTGLLISVVWVGFFAWLLFHKQAALDDMSLKEWGDFFAGVMAPLALVWLVLGYVQQGEELRLNTEALRMQQEELRNQVRETAELAAHAARQAKASEAMASVAQRQQFQQRINRLYGRTQAPEADR